MHFIESSERCHQLISLAEESVLCPQIFRFTLDPTSPLDATAGEIGTGTVPTCGIMTPSRDGDQVIGAGTNNGTTTTTAGSGFTMAAIATDDSRIYQPLAMEYRVLTGTGATDAPFRLVIAYP